MFVGRRTRRQRPRRGLRYPIWRRGQDVRYYDHYKRAAARKNWRKLKAKYPTWKGNRLRQQYRKRQMAAATPYLTKRLGRQLTNHIYKFL